MKLLIDIPEEVYNDIKVTYNGDEVVYDGVKYGTPYEEHEVKGEWIFRSGVTCGGYYKCNKCGEVERAEKNYCPNCGADMRREE